jgi:hypothetical protein
MYRFAWFTKDFRLVEPTIEAAKRISSSGMKMSTFRHEVFSMLQRQEIDACVSLIKFIQGFGIQPDNKMKKIVIRELNHADICPDFAHESLMLLSDPQDIPDLEENYLRVIKLCENFGCIDLAENTFDHFKDPTPELKKLMALIYIHAGRIDKAMERDLLEYVNPADKSSFLALFKGAQNPEDALMFLETARIILPIDEYYSLKSQLMIKFNMHEELDKVFDSIKKNAKYFRRFTFESLLYFYASKNDEEKLSFLESLKLQLQKVEKKKKNAVKQI